MTHFSKVWNSDYLYNAMVASPWLNTYEITIQPSDHDFMQYNRYLTKVAARFARSRTTDAINLKLDNKKCLTCQIGEFNGQTAYI